MEKEVKDFKGFIEALRDKEKEGYDKATIVKDFFIRLSFDLDYFDPDKLTIEFVSWKVKQQLGGKGVHIDVFEGGTRPERRESL